MNQSVFVAGHRGLVGSATLRALQKEPEAFRPIVRAHSELDLLDSQATMAFFEAERPDSVVMCAAKVGGILANSQLPVDFLHNNLRIQLNVFEAAFSIGVKRLIFLGSSCIYPRDCPQPIREDYLLTGPLEATNRAYALAKIAGVESCWSYNRQHHTNYLALMPTNMYGLGDNYHPTHSHVLPALIRRFHEAKISGATAVEVWGSGNPRREFLFSEDLGQAISFLLRMPISSFTRLTEPENAPLMNVGCGFDMTIRELAQTVGKIVGYNGRIEFDASKPDGTPQKLLDVKKIEALGWKASTNFEQGIAVAYEDFLSKLSTQ
ncbi:GDP-L-fucose synthase family protein [Variovorax jilinensis]|uniref:GDP-L-fucose synthase family protein n=1 Tax=Variovorax jilinensis TaxID=3053513 RepID=UPI0033659894